MPGPRGLTADQTSELADMFRLLGDASRLRILLACLGTAKPVGTIAEAVGLSPSLVSHHLRLLRAARLVRAKRQGRQVAYGAADAHVSQVIRDMAEHIAEPVGHGDIE
ncbi:MAG: ArsR family transcriptional regulator [Alphaproteobacteria bacterium]|nr:ArsR family transcriptional regulator [Alphaproteobacteria bacterium]